MVCSSVLVFAQESKHFRVEQDHKYRSITLNYSASSGVCYLAQGDEEDALSVYSTRDIDDFNHSFNLQEEDNNLSIVLSLD